MIMQSWDTGTAWMIGPGARLFAQDPFHQVRVDLVRARCSCSFFLLYLARLRDCVLGRFQ